jgi:DNA-binding SARP family transcriptional activator/TolB-like protein
VVDHRPGPAVMVRLVTLGSVALFDREGTHLSGEATQSKRLALLAYLAVGGRLHRRDKLVALLWPESDHGHARASLNRSLHYLRSLLGEGAIESVGREAVRLDLERVHVDAWFFRRAIETGELETALSLYRGDFLDGVFLNGLEEFEEWVEHERRELRSSAETAACQLTDRAVAKGRVQEAVMWARRAVELAPMDEAAVGRLIELTADCGDRVGALRIFEDFASTLATEFRIEPPEEITALVERIRNPALTGRDRPPAPEGKEAAGTPAPVPTARGATPAPPPRRPSAGSRSTPGKLLVTAVLLTVGLSGAMLGVMGLWQPGIDPPGVPVTVAIAPFENMSGDPGLDPFVAGLQARLVHQVATVTSASVRSVDLASHVRSDNGGEAGDGVLEGVALLLSGEVRRDGDSLVIRARLADPRSAGVAHYLQPMSMARPDAFGGIGKVADQVAAVVVSRVDFGPESSLYTPPASVEAHLEYRAGVELYAAGRPRRALVHFNRAAELDPPFVRPLLMMARVHNSAGRFDDALRVLDRLERLPRRLRPVEMRELEYHLAAAGADPKRSVAAARRLAAMAPATWSYDAGLWELRMNRPVEALRYLERVASDRWVGAARERDGYWAARSEALHRLERDDEALTVAVEGRTRFPESHLLLEREIAALAGLGRVAEARRRVWESAATGEWRCVWKAVLELRAHGYSEAALEAARAAARLTADPLVSAQVMLHFEGREDEARAGIEELVQANPDSVDYVGMSGVLRARQGDPVLDVDRRLATWDAPGIRGRNTMWRARIAAAQGDGISALRLLGQAVMEGMYFSPSLHRDMDLEPLRGYHAFEEFMRPRDAAVHSH